MRNHHVVWTLAVVLLAVSAMAGADDLIYDGQPHARDRWGRIVADVEAAR